MSAQPYPLPVETLSVAEDRVLRSVRWTPLLTGIIVLAVSLAAMTPWPIGVFYDDGIYLILAKSLATGEGYRYLNLPGQPSATHFPPAYPALLAVFWKLSPDFPANVAVFKTVNAVLLAIGAAGLAHYARTRIGLHPALAIIAVIAFTLSIPLMATATVLFSEPLMLALLGAALIASHRATADDAGDDAGSTSMSWILVAALLGGALALVRTIALSMVVATLIALLMRRRTGAAAMYAAVVATVLLPWQLWVATHSTQVPTIIEASYGSYLGLFVDAYRERGPAFLAQVFARNAVEIVRPLRALFARMAPVPAIVPLAGLALLIGLGAVRSWRRSRVLPLLAGIYVLVVMFWPYAPDRFLWGIWPVAGVLIAAGATTLWTWFVEAMKRRRVTARGITAYAAVIPVTIALASYADYQIRGYTKRWWESAQRSSAEAMLPLIAWTRNNVRPGEVVAADGDPLLYLYTGRQVIPSITWTAVDYVAPRTPAEEAADLRRLLETYGVSRLLASSPNSGSAPAVRVLLAARPPLLEIETVLPGDAAVFRVNLPTRESR